MKKEWCLVFCMVFVSNAFGADFTSPLPPPELGDNLTNYRTEQQLIERQQAQNSNKNTSEKKLDVKENKQAKENKDNTNTRQVPLMKEVSSVYDYVPNKNVSVYTRGETLIKIEDDQGKPIKISDLKVSNRGFVVSKSSEDGTVLIVPTGLNTNAKIRIVTEKYPKRPLIFVLSYKLYRQELRNIERVKI